MEIFTKLIQYTCMKLNSLYQGGTTYTLANTVVFCILLIHYDCCMVGKYCNECHCVYFYGFSKHLLHKTVIKSKNGMNKPETQLENFLQAIEIQSNVDLSW